MQSQGLDGKHNVEAWSGDTIIVATKLHVKHYRRIRFWQTGHGKLNIHSGTTVHKRQIMFKSRKQTERKMPD